MRAVRLILLFVGFTLAGNACQAADAATIRNSIARGVGYLRGKFKEAPEKEQSLYALALYKAGVAKDSPEIVETIKRVVEKCASGAYVVPVTDYGLYEVGIEATLLSDVDGAHHKKELAMLRDYILAKRLATGAWDYPTHDQSRPTGVGDTSVTQYACLGLWAVTRAGVEVDPQIWEDLLAWHTKYQNPDGGFNYLPVLHGPNSTMNMSINAVGNIHMAMLHIDPDFRPLMQGSKAKALVQQASSPEPDKLKFGVLEKVDQEAKKETIKRRSASISSASIETVRKTFNYVTSRFLVEGTDATFRSYFFYSLERMAALASVKQIGDHDWYGECADYVIGKQGGDGSWAISDAGHLGSSVDTAFCVLFLTRSTARIIRRAEEPEYGDGILAGGRGLPADLKEVQFNGREVITKAKALQPLDRLLASLQNSGDVDLEDVQNQIVEQIQLGDRKLLIGQVERLVQLVDHPSPEVRRTAIWAIGRSDRMDLGKYLIRALDDPDLGVIMEARNALCWLARKPAGFGLAEDPLAVLPPDASDQQKKDAIAAWHKSLVLAWGKWYLDNRPYDLRGDEFEARLRAQMLRLKLESAPAP
jgi:hypothetical protein